MLNVRNSVTMAIVAGGLLGISVQSRAVTTVTVTAADLGSPSSTSGNSTEAFGINENGQIVGTTYGFVGDVGYRAYIWTPTTLRGSVGNFLDLSNINHQPYGGESHGMGINNSAAVTGYFSEHPAQAPYDAFRYTSGAIDIILYWGAGQGVPAALGLAINDSGVVVGWGTDSFQIGQQPPGVFYRALKSTSGSTRVALSPLSGGSHDNSYAYAINNFGEVVGKSVVTSGAYRATLWASGSSVPIDLGLGDNSSATSIDSNGDVVGTSAAGAFVWRPTVAHGTSGTATYLGTVTGFGVNPIHINDFGKVVGSLSNSNGSTAFVYDSVNGYRALQTVVGGVTTPLTSANWINNQGQIVGVYHPAGSSVSSAFLVQGGY
jgi:probable HAF family extracellular repeat protein